MPTLRSMFPLLSGMMMMGMALASCSENITGPGTNKAPLFEAAIAGATSSFDLSPLTTTYDADLKYGQIVGTIKSSSITKTLSLSFQFDVDAGTFPKTLVEPEGSVIYIEATSSDTTRYTCALAAGCQSSITLGSKSGDTISGTFSATLINQKDTTKKIEISGGKFAAVLTRI